MYKITPETLLDHRDDIYAELKKQDDYATFIDIVTLSGTSQCDVPAKVLKIACVGAVLYPSTPDGNMFPIVNDRGVAVGYLAATPMTSFGIEHNFPVFLRVEYAADYDGIPEIICSLWCRNDE